MSFASSCLHFELVGRFDSMGAFAKKGTRCNEIAKSINKEKPVDSTYMRHLYIPLTVLNSARVETSKPSCED